ncbi:hypothetical protein KDK77_03105, partial [bacterium]|nr:hypothetical protein [bacterium]
DEMNNIMAIAALEYLDKPEQYLINGALPQHFLQSSIAVRTVLQNFHNAQQVTQGDFFSIDEFLRFVYEPVPIKPKTGIRYITRPVNRAEYFEDARTKHILALAVYALRDVMGNGFIQFPDALHVLQELLERIDDPDTIAANWPQLRKSFWESVVSRTNLSEEIKADLLTNPHAQVEFYLRGGARGLIKYQEYVEFRDRILMDNVPSFLRDDVARTAWLELINLTGDMLLSEPSYFRRLILLEQGGYYRTGDNALLVSLSLSGGFFEYGAGDVNRIVRSESAHLLSKNMYHNLKKNETVDEFQDRTAGFKFPAQLADPKRVGDATQTYRSHDNALIELYDLVMAIPELNDLEVRLKSFKGTNLIEDYAVRNALEGLKHRVNDPLAKRLIGEAVFYMLQNDEGLAFLDEKLSTLIESIKHYKQTLTTFNWDTRAFFEGGILISTFNRPFPILAPPLDVIVGTAAVKKMENRVNDPHYSGEWLHYLFRMRIRELLRSGELLPEDMKRFHDTASIFLSSVTRNGELFDIMDAIKLDIDNNRSASATYKLIALTNPDQKLGLPAELIKQLDAVRVSFVSAMNINAGQLKKIAADGFLEKYIGSKHELYERLNHYVNNVRALLSSDIPIAVASHRASASIAKIIEILSRTNQTELLREFEQVFNPVAPEKAKELSRLLDAFYTQTKQYRSNAAFTIPAIVNLIRSLSPQSVFQAIETRQVHRSEPEKRVLSEAGRILSDSLFLSGEINFARFAEFARDFYTTQYSALLGEGRQIATTGATAQNPGLLATLKNALFPFLESKGVDLLKLVKSMQPPGNAVQSPWYVGVFVASMFFGVKSVALMILAYAGVIGAGALLFWAGRNIIKKIQRKTDNTRDVEPETVLPAVPLFFGVEETIGNILPEPLRTPAISGSAALVIDYDSLLNSYDSRAGLQKVRDDLYAYLGKPDAKIVVVSKGKSREEIRAELEFAFINPDGIEILSKDDIAGVAGLNPDFNLLDFLRRSYAGDFNQYVLLTSTDSSFATDIAWRDAPKFSFDSQSFAYNPYAYFSVLTFLMGFKNLPGDVVIRSISSDSRYYQWFLEKKEAGQNITLNDLVTHIQLALGRNPSVHDINGITFGSPLSLSDSFTKEPAAQRFVLPSRVLESSL